MIIFIDAFAASVLVLVFSFRKELGFSVLICFYYISSVYEYFFGGFYSGYFDYFPLFICATIIISTLFRGDRLFLSGGRVLFVYFLVSVFFVASLFYTVNIVEGSIFTIRYIYSSIFLGFYAWVVISRDDFDAGRLIFSISALVSFIIMFSVYTDGAYQGRLTVPDTNPIYLSLLCAIVCCISFIMLIEKGKECVYTKGGYLFFFVVCSYGLLKSGGKGALVSFILAVVFYFLSFFVIRLASKRFSRKLSLVFLSVSFFLFVVLIAFFIESRAVSGVANLLEGNFGLSGDIRLETMRLWVDRLIDSPYFGVGVAGVLGYPHNVLLEVVSYLGFLGFLIALVYCFYVFYLLYRSQLSNNKEIVALSISVLCIFFNSMFSFSLNMLYVFFMLVIAQSIFLHKEKFYR